MKDLSFLKKQIIAHRGYHNKENNIPENSLAAFKKAIKYGYTIELDVHLTKDKKLVVFHDYDLKRVCGINLVIEECTYKELLKYNLYNTNYKIPLLDSVLDLVDGKVPILIETKVKKYTGELEKLLSKKLDSYNGLYAIQSFNPLSINWFKKNRKNYIIGLLSYDFKNQDICFLKRLLLKSLLCDIFLKSDFISYGIKSVPNMFVNKKKKLLIGWTVRNKKDYDNAKDYFDNLICENMEEYL